MYIHESYDGVMPCLGEALDGLRALQGDSVRSSATTIAGNGKLLLKAAPVPDAGKTRLTGGDWRRVSVILKSNTHSADPPNVTKLPDNCGFVGPAECAPGSRDANTDECPTASAVGCLTGYWVCFKKFVNSAGARLVQHDPNRVHKDLDMDFWTGRYRSRPGPYYD